MDNQITKSDMRPQFLGFYTQSTKSWIPIHTISSQSTTTSQIYRFHGFISNSCEICYFISLCYLNTNVMHYLNLKIVCTIFMCKQHEHTYNIHV